MIEFGFFLLGMAVTLCVGGLFFWNLLRKF